MNRTDIEIIDIEARLLACNVCFCADICLKKKQRERVLSALKKGEAYKTLLRELDDSKKAAAKNGK